jgi:glycolate dehydrogenase iron-sulfur subunit
MEECVQCRGCEAACPSSVPFGHLMEGARAALQRDREPSRPFLRRAGEHLGYRLVLPRHRLLLALTWLLVVAQRLHLVSRRFSLPRIEARSLREPLVAAPAEDADSYLFTGCVMDAWERDVHRAALRVMRAAGATPALAGPGGDCCGALHDHAGRTDEARALARRVIASMPGDAPVVVDSAGCGALMKDYGRLLGTPDAVAFSARVRDFSEWLAERGVPALRPTGRVVVVQDPCHLRHVQKAHQHVRTVLRPAYELRETDDDGLCCGAGGAYNVMEPELAGRIRDRKVATLRAAALGAPLLVASSNPGCEMHLAAAGLDVRHPAELVADALDDEET